MMGPKRLKHWIPNTIFAPLIRSTCKCTSKVHHWKDTVVWWHMCKQSSTIPFPTATFSPCVTFVGSTRNLATRVCTKLCVLPPSMRIVMWDWPICPYKQNASGAEEPERALKLIWASVLSGYGGRDSMMGGGGGSESGYWSSSWLINRKK